MCEFQKVEENLEKTEKQSRSDMEAVKPITSPFLSLITTNRKLKTEIENTLTSQQAVFYTF